MKAETRYVTFDGAMFIHPEDADHHEIIRRLRTKRDLLCLQVSDLMRRRNSTSKNITTVEDKLRQIRAKFLLHPEIIEEYEHVQVMKERMELRLHLKELRGTLRFLKPLLIKTNQELCKTDILIRKRIVEHDNIVMKRTAEANGIDLTKPDTSSLSPQNNQ